MERGRTPLPSPTMPLLPRMENPCAIPCNQGSTVRAFFPPNRLEKTASCGAIPDRSLTACLAAAENGSAARLSHSEATLTKRLSAGLSPDDNRSRLRKATGSPREATPGLGVSPQTKRRSGMQITKNTLTDMHAMNNVASQYTEIEGGWSPKLLDEITSEDPPTHITDSTQSPKQKAIAEFRATVPGLIKTIEALAREPEPSPDDRADGARLYEMFARRYPAIFNAPKRH
jgi:hypothetical protein